jgi:hypothetical protein
MLAPVPLWQSPEFALAGQEWRQSKQREIATNSGAFYSRNGIKIAQTCKKHNDILMPVYKK